MNSKSPRFMTFGAIALTLMTVCFLSLGAGQATAAGPQCTSPYVQVQEGATPLLPDPNMNYTIAGAWMGEPFVSCTTKRLTVVLKVGSLSPAAPPNASWTVDFNALNSLGQSLTFFVEYSTTINPAGGFNWGFHDTINDINLSQCLPLPGQPCEVTGTAAADGTITMHFVLTNALALSGLNGENFGTIGGSGTDPGAWNSGKELSLIRGHTDVFIGAAGTGFSVANSATAGDGVYIVMGNVSCSNPPVAALSATPTSGNAPLLVNFDASASNIPTGGCGTIASYIFDFGDGSPQETRTVATFGAAAAQTSHTYTTGGATYPARVRVTSTSGLTSSNIAQQNITVNSSGPPPLQSVVSRKTHGSTDFDIGLPQPPATRSTECRSGGASNTAKLVFTFLNNLTSVASASVTSGAGSIALGGAVPGPNSNQYTVNLTGVTSGQSTTVTLTNALDSTGALGNVSGIIGVLIGDTTNDGSVNSADISQTKSRSGQTVGSGNFRSDVTVDNSINSADISLTKSKSGTALP